VIGDGGDCTANVLWFGQSDDNTLLRLENTTLGEVAKGGAYGEGRRDDTWGEKKKRY
jgi:hypothetical protein